MPVCKVIQFGSPILRKKCSQITDFGSAKTKSLIRNLHGTLLNLKKIHHKGGGLAAPQIGVPKMMTYICAKGKSFAMINPRITQKSREMFSVWDFCFSENATFLGKVSRHKKITVTYQTENGEKTTETVSGYFSELYQHEIDHLNGVLFIDRLENPSEIMMMEEWGRKFKYRQ